MNLGKNIKGLSKIKYIKNKDYPRRLE